MDVSQYSQYIVDLIWAFFKRVIDSIPLFGRPKDKLTYETPKETIRIAPSPGPNTTIWRMSFSSGKPSMQVAGHFTVTNIAKCNVVVTQVKLRKPKIRGIHLVQSVKGASRGLWGSHYQIPFGFLTYISVYFDITPPVKKEGESFFADVVIIDQFGNEYLTKNVEFEYQ